METVVVAASRGSSFALSGTALMLVSVVVLAVIAFGVVTGRKYFRNRTARSV